VTPAPADTSPMNMIVDMSTAQCPIADVCTSMLKMSEPMEGRDEQLADISLDRRRTHLHVPHISAHFLVYGAMMCKPGDHAIYPTLTEEMVLNDDPAD